MVTPEVLRQYRKLRTFHVDPVYGVTANQPRADACLKTARILAWFEQWETVPRSGGDWFMSPDGNWRVRFELDQEPYDAGDLFNPEVWNPPGGERTRKAQEKAFWARIESDGVWGYALDRKCAACGSWEHIDSCWGIDDREYCRQEAASAAAYHIDKQGGWA